MPLNLADINTPYHIQKICGPEDQRHYLESLGLVENAVICILSSFFGYYVIRIKENKIGISKFICSQRSFPKIAKFPVPKYWYAGYAMKDFFSHQLSIFRYLNRMDLLLLT